MAVNPKQKDRPKAVLAFLDLVSRRQARLVTSSCRSEGGRETACCGNGRTDRASIPEGSHCLTRGILPGSRHPEADPCRAYPGNDPRGRAMHPVHIRQPRLPDRVRKRRPDNEGASESEADASFQHSDFLFVFPSNRWCTWQLPRPGTFNNAPSHLGFIILRDQFLGAPADAAACGHGIRAIPKRTKSGKRRIDSPASEWGDVINFKTRAHVHS